MNQLPRSSKQILDFEGLRDNVDPRDPSPGAALDQLNCCSIKAGELEIRRGYSLVIFES